MQFRECEDSEETELRNGCCYPIVTVKEVEDNGLHRMVQLRNPWTSDYEYRGEWNADGKGWRSHHILSSECPHADLGTFWMKAGEGESYEGSDMFKVGVLESHRPQRLNSLDP